ncbi:MAG: hypothetical protein SchgKO_21780 [Schleiferiaceae bacterium]
MSENNHPKEEVLSKVMRAGRRTYFFDVRSTRAEDYYLTITESKKHTRPDGSCYYKKHKIYLYKEDFLEFRDLLNELTEYIIEEKGEKVITDSPAQGGAEGNGFEVIEEVVEGMVEETVEESADASVESKYTDVNFEEL